MKTILPLILAIFWALAPAHAQRQGEKFEALTRHFHQLVDSGQLAGTVMMVAEGQLIYTDVYGMADRERQRPMRLNTLFSMASMTKPIVSVAAMMLVEEGKFKLDDPVGRYLPAFINTHVFDAVQGTVPPRRPITVRDLFMHTSGITSGDFDASPTGAAYREAFAENPASLDELVQILGELPLAHHPGDRWTYGYSTDVLALLVEQASGMPIDQFLHTRLFGPLGMTDTGFKVPPEKTDRVAAMYGADLKLRRAPEESPNVLGTIFPRGNTGLVSTLSDYSRFVKMLVNGGEWDGKRYLKPESLSRMLQNRLPESQIPLQVGNISTPGQGFGLGFGVLVEDTDYGGRKGDCFWPGAAFTYFFLNPDTGVYGVFLTQFTDLRKLHFLYEFHGLANAIFTGNEEAKGLGEKG
ncbi:MAG: serine hydrolase domain-containing protein [Saprospiraceae bacterium]